MAWLRIDDQRCLHRKIGKLSDGDYRALDALLAFCSRQSRGSKEGGTFGRDDLGFMVYVTPTGPRHVNQRHVNSFVRHGLVDEREDDWKVHDWDVYQPADPTAAERMKRYRERNANRNGNVTVTDEHLRSDRDSRARPVPSRPVDGSLKDETVAVDVEQHDDRDYSEPEFSESPPVDLGDLLQNTTANLGSNFGKVDP